MISQHTITRFTVAAALLVMLAAAYFSGPLLPNLVAMALIVAVGFLVAAIVGWHGPQRELRLRRFFLCLKIAAVILVIQVVLLVLFLSLGNVNP